MSTRSHRFIFGSAIVLLLGTADFAVAGPATNSFVGRWESVRFTSRGLRAFEGATNLVLSVFKQEVIFYQEDREHAQPRVLLEMELQANGPGELDRFLPLKELSGHAIATDRMIIFGVDSSTKFGMLYRFTNDLLHLELGDGFNTDLRRTDSHPRERPR